MSLIYCPECKKETSDRAENCSHCGHPINQYAKVINVPIQTVENKGNGLGIAGFIVGLIGGILFWVPVLGFLLLILGFILSLVGLILGISPEKNKRLSIAGLIISLLFLGLLGLITY